MTYDPPPARDEAEHEARVAKNQMDFLASVESDLEALAVVEMGRLGAWSPAGYWPAVDGEHGAKALLAAIQRGEIPGVRWVGNA